MLNYSGRVGYDLTGFHDPLPSATNLITGEGRMKNRPPDKVGANHKRKKKTARAMAKQGRRRNR